MSVQISAVRVSPGLSFSGTESAELKLDLRVTARLVEYDRRPGSEELERIEALLEERLLTRTEATLTRLQSWQADCTGLGVKAALACPGRWADVQESWPRYFSQAARELSVRVTVQE